MRDQVEIDSARAGLPQDVAVHGDSGQPPLMAGLQTGRNSSLPILPHILAAIFGVFAIAIVILWLSISLWSRPDPHRLGPGGAPLQAPADPSP